jgi:dihydrofolate reductase
MSPKKTRAKRRAPSRSKLLLSMAVSLDGFLADAKGGVGWLDPFGSDDVGMEAFFASVTTFIMGRTTYDQVLTFPTWPYSGKRVVVLTRRPLRDAPEGVEARADDPAAIVKDLKKSTKGIVWHQGGGISAQPYLDRGLVDELQLDVVPVTLGRGIPLFQPGSKPLKLSLIETRSFSSGIVRLRYRVVRVDASRRK